MADETILTLAADIVSAHVSNSSVAPDQLHGLIQAVYASFADLGKPQIQKRATASFKPSVRYAHTQCMIAQSRYSRANGNGWCVLNLSTTRSPPREVAVEVVLSAHTTRLYG